MNGAGSGWDGHNRDRYERGYENGEYRVLVKPRDWHVATNLPQQCTDFDVRVQARIEGSVYPKYYGLIFRRKDEENFYAFMVDPTTGQYRLLKRKNAQ